MTKHIDGKKFKRGGWFQKKEDGMPAHKDYRNACGTGFKGARWDAHHILPQTSIETATSELKGPKKTYINNVKYITSWIINNPDNMLGMPQFASYLFYYQHQEGKLNAERINKGVEQGKVKRYANTFNRLAKADRQDWLKNLAGNSPEGYPIHRPVSWGHTIYNKNVKGDVKSQIWDPLNEKQKQHEVDAAKVEGLLNTMSNTYRSGLLARGRGTLAMWQKRYVKTDTTWFAPFTMVDLKKNPLFG